MAAEIFKSSAASIIATLQVPSPAVSLRAEASLSAVSTRICPPALIGSSVVRSACEPAATLRHPGSSADLSIVSGGAAEPKSPPSSDFSLANKNLAAL